ncbi:hypothetical protein DXB54_09965 [Coprococcus sp. OM04-5BH]|jgi:hypothetical protein|nr:hypothetical protein DXB54_09965 [Coprococcus sp. OM04-5BH]
MDGRKLTDDYIKAKDMKKIHKKIADDREQLIDKLNITILEKASQTNLEK